MSHDSHHASTASTSTLCNFDAIFNSALDTYKNRTNQDLRTHPLCSRLDACTSHEAIIDILKEQFTELSPSENTDVGFTKWIVPTVNVLYVSSAILGEAVSLTFSPAKAIFAGVDVLLLAAGGIRARRATLIRIFTRMEAFFTRLQIYTSVSPTLAMTSIMADIMVEVISLLGFVTKEVKQCRIKTYLKVLFGNTDVEDAFQRLNDLTNEEVGIALAESRKDTHDVGKRVQNVGRGLEGVADKVNGVYDKVEHVDEVVQDVLDDVQDVNVVLRGVSHGVQDISHDVLIVRDKVDCADRNLLGDNLRNWLSPPNPSTNHNILWKAHLKGTTNWFTCGNIFNDWKSAGSLLWIHGNPGSGKSVLCSAIIEDVMSLRESGKACVAYFYCDFRDDDKQSRRNILHSVVVQLSARSKPRYDILTRLYSSHDRGLREPSDCALTECVKKMLTVPSHGPTYIILDALDECPNTSGIQSPRKQVLDLMKELVGLRLPNLHICVTSRPEVDIRDVLQRLALHQVSLHNEKGQKQAIIDYITSVVYSDDNMRRWREEDRDLVIRTLSAKADGMFQWVFCHLETLRQALPVDVQSILEGLPECLDMTYEQILKGICKPKRGIAHRLMQCLVVAVHPLRIEELAEVIVVDFAAKDTPPMLKPRLRWADQENAVKSACSSLVNIVGDDHSRFVQFSHYSVKEYLMSDRFAKSNSEVSCYRIQLEPAHTILALACLGVLLGLDHDVDRDSIKKFPLARYAAQYWVKHAQFKNVASSIEASMNSLFDVDKPHFSTWLWVYDADDHTSIPCMRPSKSKPVPLYYAGLFGFRDLARRLIENHPKHIYAQGGYHGTPLHASTSGGHVGLSSLLIHHLRDDVDIRNIRDETPLHLAAREGYLEIGQQLLSQGANVDAQDKDGWTPLHSAAFRGKVEFAQTLLEHRASTVNAANNDGRGPLHLASIRGQVEVIQLLLKYGADRQARDNDGLTPREIASTSGNDGEIVQLLSQD